jgi:hypothetical protein
MYTLKECAENLTVTYSQRAKLNLTVWRAGQALEARARELRPDTGWPGKNDEARAAAKDEALAADQLAQNASVDLDAAKGKLIELEAEIAGIEADRRAGEWRIRERMVEALVNQGVAQQSRGDRAEAAPEDVLQHRVDAGVFDAKPSLAEAEPVEEEIPF